MDNQQFYKTLDKRFLDNEHLKLLVVLIQRSFCQVLKALPVGRRINGVHGFSSCSFFGELLFPSEESRAIDHFLVYHGFPRTHDANFLPTYNRIIRKLSDAFLPNDHRGWVHQHYPFEMIFFL